MYQYRELERCYLSDKPCYDKKGAQTAKNKRWKEDHIELRIYPCKGHWHLTSKIKKKERNKWN